MSKFERVGKTLNHERCYSMLKKAWDEGLTPRTLMNKAIYDYRCSINPGLMNDVWISFMEGTDMSQLQRKTVYGEPIILAELIRISFELSKYIKENDPFRTFDGRLTDTPPLETLLTDLQKTLSETADKIGTYIQNKKGSHHDY
jgi:hypothetical protein